jgi:predicted HTH transcriptional regulator
MQAGRGPDHSISTSCGELKAGACAQGDPEFVIPNPLNEVTEVDIQRLKATGREEGTTIELKRELPGARDEDKLEFLADVSSFANTEGGDIIYGVSEDQDVITHIVGISSLDFNAGIIRLENLMRHGVSPQMSDSFRTVPGETGKLIVIRIERS